MELKTISISVTDFALPVPRRGSIETLSGFNDGAAAGQEIHIRVQKQRAKNFSNYQPEVILSHEFKTEKYIFKIGGRIDGYFSSPIAKIEEIKTAFSIEELKSRLRAGPLDHPYSLQLQTYGYLHYLQHNVIPKLSFHLVSTRNFKTQDMSVELDQEKYEHWLQLRLAELIIETEAAEERVRRRKKVGSQLVFPFTDLRMGQQDLMDTITDGMNQKKRLLVQAPTGLGKTVGVLYPTLKEALARGQRVIYITPKNSQHTVAEDAIERFQETGAKVKSLTITAKSKMCMKNEPLCNPDYCEFARDHYTKVAENKIPEQLAKKRKLTAKTFKKIAMEYEVCPFELQLDVAHEVDTVICDYNYAFAPRTAFGRLAANGLDQEGKPNLVVDEAHNIPSRTMDYYSPQLSTAVLDYMQNDVGTLPLQFQSKVSKLINECITIVSACRPESGKAEKIDPPTDAFLLQDGELREFLSRYLESDVEIQRRDLVLRLCFYWSAFTETLEFLDGREEFFMTFQPHISGGILKITCCDASAMLKECYDDYEHVVGFSATLKPFSFYGRLAGLESADLKTAEFASPFPKSQRKLLVVPQVSSKYSTRERNYPKISEAIARIASLKRGNYFAFFPSFDFMERVLAQFRLPDGFNVIRQERNMNRDAIETVFSELRMPHSSNLVFAVQGGVFAEGVDYPGEMAIGAFIVGAPLPIFDLEREHMREYYEKFYAAGFDYAYTFPAMAKAVQAAGRVIRSETDRGIIILMDDRFIHPNFEKSMPADWFNDSARELISGSILQEVQDFWGTI